MHRPEPIPPGPGQESVWDYPRPPRLEDTPKRIRVIFNGVTIADTQRARRVLETSHPPTYYLPPDDVAMEYLTPTSSTSLCEWKGQARYYTVTVNGKQATDAAWCYPNPVLAFIPIKDYLVFYAIKMEACYVGDELAKPQGGGFYGGWITSDVVGPFKVGPGRYSPAE
jgi:uncharacterized protein (DUF427 family)